MSVVQTVVGSLGLAIQFAYLKRLNPTIWTNATTVEEWLHRGMDTANAAARKGAQSLLMLTSWEIWRERNRRIFQREELSVAALVAKVRDEAMLWNVAGASIPFDPG